MIKPDEIPVVGVITLVYNRPEWFAHAVRNIQTCDYPRDKLVWVIVDDSDGLGRVDVNVEKLKTTMPDLKVRYVSSGKKLHIGEKRNRGCAAAIEANPDTSVFMFMDDDDHYPKASVIMRVLWLRNSKKGAVYCSTLPMYDINKYISAINVPPLNLSPCKRVSEASMCISRQFWEARKFPNDVSVAEGELFLKDRELDSMEIPPEGIIVSFLHGKNSTSRRVPEQKEANGCHYGFSDEYFIMISKIAQTT
jgi:cellulose synthase/poly-beta-1,6-N-acetylglucosamine synthase-like glycosyltransferase